MIYLLMAAILLGPVGASGASSPLQSSDEPADAQVQPLVPLNAEQQQMQLRGWELLDLAEDGMSRKEVVEQLSRLADRDVRPLFDVYVGATVREEDGPVKDPIARTALLREALASIAPEQLFAYLRAEVVESAAMETRLRSLELLAECLHAQRFDLVREVLTGADPLELTSPQVRARIETSLRAALECEQRGLREISKDPASLAPALWPLMARAAPEGAAGTELLLGLLGLEAALDCVVLERLAEHARKPTGFGGGRTHVVVVERVRDRLGHAEWKVREQALLTMGYLADPDSFPTQIGLLNDPQRSVQRAAAWSLEQATGMRFGSDGERWSAWFEEQIAWFREAGAQAQRKLLACPDADAIAIIRDFTPRKIFRHALSDMLAPVLFRENHYVVGAVCTTMKQLGSPKAIGHLIEGLEHADPECRALIHRTLRELTGLELSASESAWAGAFRAIAE